MPVLRPPTHGVIAKPGHWQARGLKAWYVPGARHQGGDALNIGPNSGRFMLPDQGTVTFTHDREMGRVWTFDGSTDYFEGSAVPEISLPFTLAFCLKEPLLKKLVLTSDIS